MSLHLENLNNENIRELMLSEVEKDIANGTIYISKRFKENSMPLYLEILREAMRVGDAEFLERQIQNTKLLRTHEQRRKRSSGYSNVKIPYTAAMTVAEGEFNRFYLRALCLKALEDDLRIQAYRAKKVAQPRPTSEALIGNYLDPNKLLTDLRESIGQDPALKLPGGANSGISGRLVK